MANNAAPISKWDRHRYTPNSARFSTERLDLILAKLKTGDNEGEPGDKNNVINNESVAFESPPKEESKSSGKGNRSWNVYIHDSPFEKNRSIFEDLMNKNCEKEEEGKETETEKTDNRSQTLPRRTKLKSYDEFMKDRETEQQDSSELYKVTIKLGNEDNNNSNWIKPEDSQPNALEKFADDIDTVPTRDTGGLDPVPNTQNHVDETVKSDTVSITSSGNDANSRDTHHNDSGFLDELSPTEGSEGKKAVSFSIGSDGLVGERKCETLPRRNTRPKDGFVSKAKNWWQQNLEGSDSRSSSKTDLNKKKSSSRASLSGSKVSLSGSRMSLSEQHIQQQRQKSNVRPTTPVQFKDRFSSAVLKSPEEKQKERKYHDNTNAPPLSMQSTNAFKIWKLRDELDNKTRDAENFVDNTDTLKDANSRPTTPSNHRIRPKTPTRSRPTTPSSELRKDGGGRKLPQVPGPSSRLMAPTKSSEARSVRPTTPKNDRVRPTTPSAERVTSPVSFDRSVRPTTPSAERMRPTTPTRDYDRRVRPTTPTRDYDRRIRPTTPTRDYESRVRPTTPTRDYDSRVRPITPTRDYDRRTRPTTPSRDHDRRRGTSPVAFGSHFTPKEGTPAPERERFRTRSQPNRDRALSPGSTERSRVRPTTPTRERALSPTMDESPERRGRQQSAPVENRIRRIRPTTPTRDRARSPGPGEGNRSRPTTPTGIADKQKTMVGSCKDRLRPTTPTNITTTNIRSRVRPTTPTRDRVLSPSPERIRPTTPTSTYDSNRGRIQPSVDKTDSIQNLTNNDEESSFPVAPPRRFRKNRQGTGRTLPSVPTSQDSRPKSPGLAMTRSRTPVKTTEIAGEGEPDPEPVRDRADFSGRPSLLNLTMSSEISDDVFSPGSADTDEIGDEIKSSLQNKQTGKDKLVSEEKKPLTLKTGSLSKAQSKSKLDIDEMDRNEGKGSALLSKYLNSSLDKPFSPPPISPESDRPFSPPPLSPPSRNVSKGVKSTDVGFRPVTPIESKIRPTTPTRSILKKTSRTPLSPDSDSYKSETSDDSSTKRPPWARQNRDLKTPTRVRDPSPKRSTWTRNRVSLRTNLDRKTSPSFENLGKSLFESLSPTNKLDSFGAFKDNDDDKDKEQERKNEQDQHKRDSPKKKKDMMRRNTIEGLPNITNLLTTTLTLPHRRPESKNKESAVRWDPSSFKSNSLGRGLSRSNQDLRAALGSSKEDLSKTGGARRSKTPTFELGRAPSPLTLGGSSVSSRFRRFESMDALEMWETGSNAGGNDHIDLDEGPDFVQCEFFV